jgi:ankyrin repeat protein
MQLVIKIFLFLAFHGLVQANDIERTIEHYPKTLQAVGANPDDLLARRLNLQSLPKELFNLPKQAQLREAILIDMLAFYYLGYRVTSIFVKTDNGFFTRAFNEKGRSVSEWKPIPQATFDKAATSLKDMKALPLASIAALGKPSGSAITGYLGDRTYNSVEPQAPHFAGYIGIVSVLKNTANRLPEVLNQFPIAIQDYWDVSVSPSNREPRLGRVLMAIQGKTTAEIAESKQAQSLEAAIVSGDSESINKAIKNATDANASFLDQWSPLMLAISAKQLTVANLLITRGANVNAKDKDGTSALALAISSRWRPGIELLLSKKANPNTISTFKGETPLSMSIWQKDLALIELLLRNGANPNFIGAYGADALQTAIQSGRTDDQEALNTTASVVKLLLKYGANAKYVSDMGCATALSELRQKSPQLIEQLGSLLSTSEAPRLACQKKREETAKQTSS